MEELNSKEKNILERKIDFLVELVQDLRLEVRSLKREVQQLKSDGSPGTRQTKQEDPRDPDDTPIIEGDICEVLNNYKGLKNP